MDGESHGVLFIINSLRLIFAGDSDGSEDAREVGGGGVATAAGPNCAGQGKTPALTHSLFI